MLAASVLTLIAVGTGWTQPAAGGPPAVGIVEAIKRPITESSEFLGRIEAVNRVNVVARVTAFLEERLFVDGAELKKGDPLYRLERGPSRGRSRVEAGASGPAPGDAR
ncbi:multidrug efflux pump subunit AcrA (membrane-fusion protein) [Bradyrhizobium sp. AZCC 2230]